MNRRQFLLSAAAAVAVPRLARGFGPRSEVNIAELDLGAGTISRPDAWERLLHETEQTTSVEVHAKPVRVTPDSDELFAFPFVVLAGSGAFEMPGERGLEQLARYISYGGFLFIDETSGADNSGFDKSVRRMVELIFPTRPLAPIPSDHSVYRSFFLLSKPVGRLDRHRYMEGITVDGIEGKGGHSPLMYCRNDVSGALDRAPNGQHRYPCTPGGETQRREAVKLGINLILYCIATDYKKDQAHVKQLMLDRRLDADWELGE